MPTKTKIPCEIWIWCIAAVNVFIHLFFYDTLGFHRDELLYFSLGTHPSFGYASVPPLVGWTAWLMSQVFGFTLFAARILPALLSSVLILLSSSIAKEMGGKGYARILTAIGVLLTPINLRGFLFFQPVFLDVLFWTLLFYLAILFINRQKTGYLILFGLVAGVAFLNKYLVLLQIFCMAVVFLFSPQRKLFFTRSLLWAAIVALVIALPNLIWQIVHDLPVITHMNALNRFQLVHVNRMEFLAGQIFIGFMASVLTVPGLIAGTGSSHFSRFRPLFIASFLVIAILCFLRGKIYYTAGLIPFLAAAGSVAWERWIRAPWLRSSLALLIILVSVPFFPIGIPVMKPEGLCRYFKFLQDKMGFDTPLRWEDATIHSLPQDFADMLGWEEMAMITAKAYGEVKDTGSCMIYCENYGEAGAVTVLGKKYGLPQPACFSESFLYWTPSELPREIETLIYVNSEMGDDVKALFSDIREVGHVGDPLAREHGTTVYLCTGPTGSFREFWKQRMAVITDPF
jgi:hypothetical protein